MKEKIPFKNQEKQSLKENIALYNRAKSLKERALKLMKKESENKNENTNA